MSLAALTFALLAAAVATAAGVLVAQWLADHAAGRPSPPRL
jgi:hypothetical protein